MGLWRGNATVESSSWGSSRPRAMPTEGTIGNNKSTLEIKLNDGKPSALDKIMQMGLG
jgi:hypothetical protein